jgi:hypothetical protein
VSAKNLYGTSTESLSGNGAIILTNPDPPLNFVNNPKVTNSVQIGLTWNDGVSNGGAPVLDYTIQSD